MKLNAPDDSLSKWRGTFDSVSIMQLQKNYFLDFHYRFFVGW